MEEVAVELAEIVAVDREGVQEDPVRPEVEVVRPLSHRSGRVLPEVVEVVVLPRSPQWGQGLLVRLAVLAHEAGEAIEEDVVVGGVDHQPEGSSLHKHLRGPRSQSDLVSKLSVRDRIGAPSV